MQHSVRHTFLFAAAVCIVCGILVSSSAVSLADRQEQNAALDKSKNVLMAAGLVKPGEVVGREEVNRRFEQVRPVAIDLATGEATDAVDPAAYDALAAAGDPATSREAPPNKSAIKRLPNHVVIYEVLDAAGAVEMYVLPVQGYGLWSTLYGFVALDADLNTIRGLTYYQHGETAGLGGEVDNPRWKALWPGRKAFDDSGAVAIRVIKGAAGPAESDPHHVDGLSGSTLTSNGVTNMLYFWLGENGFGPFLERVKGESDG